MITKLGMVSFIIVHFIYVIDQQTSITVQYKINLKCMFKDILYPTYICSVVFKIKLLTGVTGALVMLNSLVARLNILLLIEFV